MTTTINNKHKKLNVPNLRFPEFQGEWTTSLLSDYLTENKERNKKGEFDKTDVLSVSGDYGVVNQIELLGRSFAGASVLPYHVVRHGNIVYTKSPLKEYPYGIVKANTGVDGIVSTLYAVYNIKNNVDAQFIEYYFSSANRTNRYFKPIVRIGAKHDMKIGNQEVLANKVTFPNLEEQTKIASLFRFLDERIATQNKIIDKLQSLIKGIAQHCIRELINGWEYVRLGDICKITTGKLDANAQVENGQYPFFTCAERPFNIDSYAFDTEALLISGNGANLGYINYYKGKFNAYQRTYVLDHFSVNIQYVKWALKVLLPQRIAIEKSSSNTPYIVLSTLADLKILIPNNSKQNQIADLMMSFERKLSTQLALSDLYNKQKQYLLHQMFI